MMSSGDTGAPLERFSEPYAAVGGMAAVGVLNQLGRPDTEPLEVLVREAVQNCWDARRPEEHGITVEIGRRGLDVSGTREVARRLLPDPPPGLPLRDCLSRDLEILYFADFGTGGLAGPTRADLVEPDAERDFVDFVRNIGQPPDKELGGGSYGFGKAAFYLASDAGTVVIDTSCRTGAGIERRLIAYGLGEQYSEAGRPYTGRHWWGRMVDGVPEPVGGSEAAELAGLLGLPPREGARGLGTTVAIVAPAVMLDEEDESDVTMSFIAQALAWNFWPRMTSAPGGVHSTMRFVLRDGERRITVPDPRGHPRLRGFVEAMDRLRSEELSEEDEDPLVIDRPIECLRPIRRLGRLVIQRGPVAPASAHDGRIPEGARVTAGGLHHVALMRNAELVVRYLPGAEPVGRIGYSGAFRCSVDVDSTFRSAEPPTHDNWVPTFLTSRQERTFVKVALDRIAGICREAAGYEAGAPAGDGGAVPLGEFADQLATLMPTIEGPGARKSPVATNRRPARRNAPGHDSPGTTDGEWVVGGRTDDVLDGHGDGSGGGHDGDEVSGAADGRGDRPPMIRNAAEPELGTSADDVPVVIYRFELKPNGNAVKLSARVEVMTNDGAQVESEAPIGSVVPEVREWIDPSGAVHPGASAIAPADVGAGDWRAVVALHEDAMMRIDVVAERA